MLRGQESQETTISETTQVVIGEKVRSLRNPELGIGRVIEVEEIAGRRQFDVLFHINGEKVVRTCLVSDLEPAGGPIEDLLAGKVDSAELFELRQLAFILPSLNLGGQLSNARTELLPHQVLLTHRVISAPRRRFLIADEVGLGKTIEVGMVVRELVARGEAARILVIVPAGLIDNWWHELKDRFGLEFYVFGSESKYERESVWEKHPRTIASIDRLKRKERVETLRKSPLWDAVVFDEAHHLTKRRYGRKTRSTLNYRLAEALKDRTRDLLLLSATPHQGDQEQFFHLICLLDDQLFSCADAIAANRERLDRVMIRRTKREVTDAEGRPIFARRQVFTESFTLSAAEARFYDCLNAYLTEGYNLAESDPDDPGKRVVGFVMTTFQKLASSSPKAIQVALCKHLLRLLVKKIIGLKEMDRRGFAQSSDRNELRVVEARAVEMTQDLLRLPRSPQGVLDARQYLLREEREILKRRSAAELAESLEATEYSDAPDIDEFAAIYIGIPDEINKVEALLRVVPEGIDRKLDTLLRAIERIQSQNTREKFLIFTQYRQTQDYLQTELERRYGQGKVVTIKGGELEAKLQAAREFWKADGAQFLISTSAGGEGINLQVCRVLFNYDLPWNPMVIEQRIGRIHRFGQRDTAQVYNLVATDTIEGQVHLELQNKLVKIAGDIGKRNTDGSIAEDFLNSILGPLSESLPYDKLYRQALLSRDFQRTAEEIEQGIKDALEASRILESLSQGLEPFNLEKYRKIRSEVTAYDLGSFVARFLSAFGRPAKITGQVMSVDVPPVLEGLRLVRPRYEALTFSRDLAMKNPDAELCGLGHPLVEAVISYCTSPSFGGRTATRKIESSISGGAEVIYQFNYLVTEDDGSQRRSRLVIVPISAGLRYLPEAASALWKRSSSSRGLVLCATDRLLSVEEAARTAIDLEIEKLRTTTEGERTTYSVLLDSVAVIQAADGADKAARSDG